MTSEQEKAIELLRIGRSISDDLGSPYPEEHSKLVAKIIVDEIMSEKEKDIWMGAGNRNNPKWWEKVKQEIEK